MKLLWDLDGTIFDTYPVALNTFNEIHEQLHGTPVNKAVLLPMLKRSSKEAFEYFHITEEFQIKFRTMNRRRSETNSVPFTGIKAILEAAEMNVMVTHRAKNSTKASLGKWDFLQYFTEVVSPDDDGFPRKPATPAYRYLHEKYNLDWAIGDRALDLIPAKAVGLKTCAFQNEEIDADLHVDSYTMDLKDKLQASLL